MIYAKKLKEYLMHLRNKIKIGLFIHIMNKIIEKMDYRHKYKLRAQTFITKQEKNFLSLIFTMLAVSNTKNVGKPTSTELIELY